MDKNITESKGSGSKFSATLAGHRQGDSKGPGIPQAEELVTVSNGPAQSVPGSPGWQSAKAAVQVGTWKAIAAAVAVFGSEFAGSALEDLLNHHTRDWMHAYERLG